MQEAGAVKDEIHYALLDGKTGYIFDLLHKANLVDTPIIGSTCECYENETLRFKYPGYSKQPLQYLESIYETQPSSNPFEDTTIVFEEQDDFLTAIIMIQLVYLFHRHTNRTGLDSNPKVMAVINYSSDGEPTHHTYLAGKLDYEYLPIHQRSTRLH
ncbi:hypothetical protein L0B53_18965 (plasmid) [Vibrio sp. SS-MA-C1-2]|uniref:hypothetical protein n=1 Tax=Vibrio sp. SS-MA-C1-2 TaxID=2908646 RepID=UPI001F2223B8|nr:hypothetical protein [Vibrio sp. SS-MA-C1-2]UJF20218.1 hypothetical protein L0B53_18965 [Vibrio sp. SS-MA-C1-2]